MDHADKILKLLNGFNKKFAEAVPEFRNEGRPVRDVPRRSIWRELTMVVGVQLDREGDDDAFVRRPPRCSVCRASRNLS